MNTLVIVLIAAVLLCCAYVFYGRWLANKWGIDQRQRHQQRNSQMERITFRQTAGQYSVISFRQSQVQVLLPAPFRQLYLDGFLFYCGY